MIHNVQHNQTNLFFSQSDYLIQVFDKIHLLYVKQCRFRGRQHSFVEIDHEIFSTVILSLLLIQVGQLSVSGERMCTILVNRLED